MLDDLTTLDVRDATPLSAAQSLLQHFEQLRVGQSCQLLTSNDPKSLRSQLQVRAGDGFSWTALESGPAQWRVQIGKVLASASNCCSGGACCG